MKKNIHINQFCTDENLLILIYIYIMSSPFSCCHISSIRKEMVVFRKYFFSLTHSAVIVVTIMIHFLGRRAFIAIVERLRQRNCATRRRRRMQVQLPARIGLIRAVRQRANRAERERERKRRRENAISSRIGPLTVSSASDRPNTTSFNVREEAVGQVY